MKKKYVVYPLLIILISYLAYHQLSSGKEVNNREKQSASPLSVQAIIAESRVFDDQLMVTGNIQANESIALRAEISGIVTDIHFKEGAFVKKGTVLLQINNRDLKAQLNKAIAQKKLAEGKEYRAKILMQKEAISREEYESSLTDLNSLKAEVQLITAQLAKAVIVAPFSGFIGLKNISPGDYITPTTLIADLVDAGLVKINFAVPTRYMSRVNKQSPISFTIQGSKRIYTASIYAMDPTVDQATRTLMFRASTPNEDRSLTPGSFVKVSVPFQEVEKSILVPTQAIVPVMNGKKVYLYRDGKAVDAPVETDVRTKDEIQIISGIKPGDTVITTGIMSIRSGTPIQVVINK